MKEYVVFLHIINGKITAGFLTLPTRKTTAIQTADGSCPKSEIFNSEVDTPTFLTP
jgi:hypothetical protein